MRSFLWQGIKIWCSSEKVARTVSVVHTVLAYVATVPLLMVFWFWYLALNLRDKGVVWQPLLLLLLLLRVYSFGSDLQEIMQQCGLGFKQAMGRARPRSMFSTPPFSPLSWASEPLSPPFLSLLPFHFPGNNVGWVALARGLTCMFAINELWNFHVVLVQHAAHPRTSQMLPITFVSLIGNSTPFLSIGTPWAVLEDLVIPFLKRTNRVHT